MALAEATPVAAANPSAATEAIWSIDTDWATGQ
jgi:hypothetical protein